jgi:SOS response regulatory protein OraA/RecX
MGLSDGSSFLIHAEIAAREGIRAERELDSGEIESLVSRSELIFARQKALSLLSRSAHTRKGLELKLKKRGYGARAVVHAL